MIDFRPDYGNGRAYGYYPFDDLGFGFYLEARWKDHGVSVKTIVHSHLEDELSVLTRRALSGYREAAKDLGCRLRFTCDTPYWDAPLEMRCRGDFATKAERIAFIMRHPEGYHPWR